MPSLDAGFWFSIIIWFALAAAATVTAYVLHVRESRG